MQGLEGVIIDPTDPNRAIGADGTVGTLEYVLPLALDGRCGAARASSSYGKVLFHPQSV